MNRAKISKALKNLGYHVSTSVHQVMNGEGKWLPILLNLDAIRITNTDGWSLCVSYDDIVLRDLYDNNGDVSAIGIQSKHEKDVKKAQTFLMFIRQYPKEKDDEQS